MSMQLINAVTCVDVLNHEIDYIKGVNGIAPALRVLGISGYTPLSFKPAQSPIMSSCTGEVSPENKYDARSNAKPLVPSGPRGILDGLICWLPWSGKAFYELFGTGLGRRSVSHHV